MDTEKDNFNKNQVNQSEVNNKNAEIGYCAFSAKCPTRLVLNRIADKWTVLVVILLQTETKRFSQLQREIDGISQKMLTQTLRGLERDGLVNRTVHASVPPKVEYALTPLGHTLKDLLYAVKTWSETHINAVQTAQKSYDNLNAK
jgi:DNA-binding HxlR family transcriptional regulator